MRTFWDVIRSDVQMTVRNKQALFWTFFFPVLLMGLLGIVFGQQNAFTPKVAIVNQDGGPLSQTMIMTLHLVPALKVSQAADQQTALADLKNGDYAAVLVLPKGLQQNFKNNTTPLPFYYDNSSLIQAGTVIGVTQQVLQKMADALTGSTPKFALQQQAVAAKGFNYIDFLVPGVIAMALMSNGIYAVSGTFVAYRQKGVLRRLRATPMPIGSFITARVLVHLVVALIQAGLVLLVGVGAFHVHVTGTDTLLKVGLLALIGSSSFVTIGFFVASVSKNTEVADALGQVIGTPMMFLSGIFFPMDNAPAWIQPVVHAMPLKYLADALRNVIIKGQTLWFVRWDILVLMVVSTVFLGLSVRFFRWE
jgi:ABC-2 type transport system permease protein